MQASRADWRCRRRPHQNPPARSLEIPAPKWNVSTSTTYWPAAGIGRSNNRESDRDRDFSGSAPSSLKCAELTSVEVQHLPRIGLVDSDHRIDGLTNTPQSAGKDFDRDKPRTGSKQVVIALTSWRCTGGGLEIDRSHHVDRLHVKFGGGIGFGGVQQIWHGQRPKSPQVLGGHVPPGHRPDQSRPFEL